jgi:hypothetical protein
MCHTYPLLETNFAVALEIFVGGYLRASSELLLDETITPLANFEFKIP